MGLVASTIVPLPGAAPNGAISLVNARGYKHPAPLEQKPVGAITQIHHCP
jgi:hypothetical protein